VESAVVAALSQLFNHPGAVTASGSTDAGVHARQQTINVRTGSRIRTDQVQRGANSLLPEDIAVTRVLEVPGDFNARRCALSRTYRYQLRTGPARRPLSRLTEYHYRRGTLDVAAMAEAAAAFVGTHDFTSFRSLHCDADNPVRRVFHSRLWTEDDGLIVYDIRAWAFLRHMVRTLMGTLISVGEGKLTPGVMRGILAARDREAAGPTAPACGLILWEVEYP